MRIRELQKLAFVSPKRPNPSPLLAQKDGTAFLLGLLSAWLKKRSLQNQGLDRFSPYQHCEVTSKLSSAPVSRMSSATQNTVNHLHRLSHSVEWNLVRCPSVFHKRQCFWRCQKMARGTALEHTEGRKAKHNQDMDEKSARLRYEPIHRYICQARWMQNLEREGKKEGENKIQTWGSTWPHTCFKHVLSSQLLSTHLTLLNRNAVLQLGR